MVEELMVLTHTGKVKEEKEHTDAVVELTEEVVVSTVEVPVMKEEHTDAVVDLTEEMVLVEVPTVEEEVPVMKEEHTD